MALDCQMHDVEFLLDGSSSPVEQSTPSARPSSVNPPPPPPDPKQNPRRNFNVSSIWTGFCQRQDDSPRRVQRILLFRTDLAPLPDLTEDGLTRTHQTTGTRIAMPHKTLECTVQKNQRAL
ncbi:hypothetical protein OIDMADRAFT_49842 [Oidiodendron maius Zn]|uniref:Uncharacterized protein n=1 Tax=Oidiodendron maius (strain Zn) TaxID=913774 RepID=A0A0C3D4X9_OIDMZ|nr:hypothetical protein OIDMADRAFT_49842 [Oidiodendron maius Zn]